MTEDVHNELSSLRHMLSPGPDRKSEINVVKKPPASELDQHDHLHAAEAEYDSVLQGTQVLGRLPAIVGSIHVLKAKMGLTSRFRRL